MTDAHAIESLPRAPPSRFRSVSLQPRRMAELVKFLARDLGESEEIIAGYVRSLRENGGLPADAGGLGHVGGALVEPIHAARLLVAYLGSRSARGAMKGLRKLGAFQYQGQYVHGFDGSPTLADCCSCRAIAAEWHCRRNRYPGQLQGHSRIRRRFGSARWRRLSGKPA
jgi:hypothetical protein